MSMRRITEAPCHCGVCGWKGTVGECEPDVDGDGGIGCPVCFPSDVNIQHPLVVIESEQ